MTTSMPFWASRKGYRTSQFPQELRLYNDSPTRCCPRCRKPTLPSPTPTTHPAHPRVVHPSLFEWGNTILPCTRALDAHVAGDRYPIPISAFSALYLPLQSSHHIPVLVTPVFDVGESNDEVLSCLGPCHRRQTGTKPSLALFFILPAPCLVLPPGNHWLGCRWMSRCC